MLLTYGTAASARRLSLTMLRHMISEENVVYVLGFSTLGAVHCSPVCRLYHVLDDDECALCLDISWLESITWLYSPWFWPLHCLFCHSGKLYLSHGYGLLAAFLIRSFFMVFNFWL